MRFLRRLSQGLCSETYGLTGIYEGGAQGLIAVAVYQRPFTRSFSPAIGHNRVLLYRADDFSLVACYDTRLEINDIAFDPDISQLAIAYGRYDGGAFYNGGLTLWNYETGIAYDLICDDREVLECAFQGESIKFTVSPQDDLDTYWELERTLTTYSLPKNATAPTLLSDLVPIEMREHVPFEPYTREKAQGAHDRLAHLIDKTGNTYSPAGAVWDMLFQEDYLLSAHSDGQVRVWNWKENTCGTISISNNEKQVTQIYQEDGHYYAIAETPRRFDEDPASPSLFLYAIDPRTLSRHLISKRSEKEGPYRIPDKEMLREKYELDSDAISIVSISNDQAIALLRNNTCLPLNLYDATISVQWEMETPCDILSLAFHNGILAAGGVDGNIYLFELPKT